ncbi:MAG: ABC transporter permease [Actinomycetes bacterium]
MTVTGVTTVMRQEFRLRIRASRWRWVLGAWAAIVALFAVLVRLGLSGTSSVSADRPAGPPLFGTTMLFVLGLALLVVPALTAQSVNGDRERGTLATLQVTLLSAAEIALGKLLAAWGTAVVFLAATLPVVVWAVVEGGLSVAKVVVTLTVVALLLGVACALSLAWSAVFARSIASALVSYLTVFALTVGTLIVFGLAVALTTEQAHGSDYTYQRARPDRVWPLLAPNPFVVLADAAPRLPERRDPRTGELQSRPLDPLGSLGDSVREARRTPVDPETPPLLAAQSQDEPGPVWPLGLAVDVLLGAGAVWITVRRLRTPTHKLGRGVRIA